jgi:HSP20 family protein
MQRAFTLDTPVDESKVDASYEDGVLRVVLPKAEATPQRKISIR